MFIELLFWRDLKRMLTKSQYTHVLKHHTEQLPTDSSKAPTSIVKPWAVTFPDKDPELLRTSRFFHENAGKSAWGLAIHTKSRWVQTSLTPLSCVSFTFTISFFCSPIRQIYIETNEQRESRLIAVGTNMHHVLVYCFAGPSPAPRPVHQQVDLKLNDAHARYYQEELDKIEVRCPLNLSIAKLGRVSQTWRWIYNSTSC